MCGFCGVLAAQSRDFNAERVARMSATLAHRGPDADGSFVGDGIALAHRRLSIIDLSAAGAQPMSSGGVTLVYNGESYNFHALRAELAAQGSLFQGHSDTEVVLHAYLTWGLDGLKRLQGIFAFALWDEGRRRLVLMRDRLGVKPLFYCASGTALAFGSEIKAVMASGVAGRTIDPQAFSEYLWYGNAFEERTIYRDVRAVPPGSWLIAEGATARLEPWWSIEDWLARPMSPRDAQDAAGSVRDALDQAVGRQLVSDVPVGIFLSGGVDSSAIAASAVRAAGRAALSSYPVGFDFDRGVNELTKARRVAQLLGLDHHELQVSGANLRDVLTALARAHDEPFADAANIPLYLLARQLGGAVKVVLQGDGGDEMFGGYRRYSVLRYVRAWQSLPWPIVMVSRRAGRSGERFARMAFAAGAADAAMRMALLLTVETPLDPPTAVLETDARRELEASTDPFLAYRHCAYRFGACDAVQQMLLTDITLQLPSQFLTKVDRATMALGLEARVPLLDELVAEVAVGMPSHFKVRGLQKKIVLRDAMRERLPADILDAPKTGFGVPYEHWLRTTLYDFARDAILDPGFAQRHRLNRARLENALTEHRIGRREHGFLLWKLLQLALWSREAT